MKSNRVRPLTFTLALAATLNLVGTAQAAAPIIIEPGTVVLVAPGSCWRYSDHGLDLGGDWKLPAYDDGAWLTGFAQLGYGDGDEATVVGFGPAVATKYITTYFRRSFLVPDPNSLTNVLLRLKRDDGAVVYVNGMEVFRNNLPAGPVTAASLADLALDDGTNYLSASLSPAALIEGDNVVAVEIHQSSVESTDISFDLELTGQLGVVPPTLAVEMRPGTLVLSWPEAVQPAFVVEAASTVGPGASWNPVAGSTTVQGGRHYVTNAIGPASKFYRLGAASPVISTCQPPLVTSQPVRVDVMPGTNVDLTVQAEGGGPFTYSWRKNQRSASAHLATLSLTNVQRADGGAFDVLIGNACSCVFSCPSVLIVGGTNVALADTFASRTSFNAFSGQLNTSNAIATTEAGEPVNPAAAYDRTLWLEWTAPASGIAVFDTAGSAEATALSIYTGSTLAGLVRQTYSGSTGPYSDSRVFFNAVAGTSYQIQIDGTGATPFLCVNWELTDSPDPVPRIVGQPQSEYIPFGTQAVFSVVAVLPAPLTNTLIEYQWFKEGVPIVDATNADLILPAFTESDIARYFVVAGYNSQNSTSDLASLVGLGGSGFFVAGITNVPASGSISPPLADFGGEYTCDGTKFDHHRLYLFRLPAYKPETCKLPCTALATLKTDPYFQPSIVKPGSCYAVPITPTLCSGGTPASVTFDTTGSTVPDTGLIVQLMSSCNSPCSNSLCSDNLPDSTLSSCTAPYGTCNTSAGFLKVFLLYKGSAGGGLIKLNYRFCP